MRRCVFAYLLCRNKVRRLPLQRWQGSSYNLVGNPLGGYWSNTLNPQGVKTAVNVFQQFVNYAWSRSRMRVNSNIPPRIGWYTDCLSAATVGLNLPRCSAAAEHVVPEPSELYIYIHIYIYIYIYIHTFIQIFIHAYKNIYILINIYIYTFVYIYTYIYTYLSIYIYICIYIHAYIYIY